MKKNFLFYGFFSCLIFFPFALAGVVQATVFPCSFTWTSNFKVGSVGEDVLKLQQFLNADPDTVIARSGAGSSGNETANFGPMTAAAVAKFQKKYDEDILVPAGLSKGTGFVGNLTRAKLNSLCGPVNSLSIIQKFQTTESVASSVNDDAMVNNKLTVTVPDQPAPTLAPAGAGWVPFTSVKLTAGSEDVTVNSINVQRVGYGSDGAFDSIQLADEDGNALGDSRSLRSDHKVDLGDPFTIPASKFKTITVMANMVSDLADFDGQMPIFQINDIQTSAKIAGTLPVRGTAQTVNSSLVIGTANAAVSQFDPGASVNRYINDTNVRFSGIRLTADSREDLALSSVTWEQTGTAGSADFTNVTTSVNGVYYPTTVDGRKFTSTFSPSIIIKKGYSVDIYVQGDLTTSGSNRTVEFDIAGSGDISVIGQSYGYYVLVIPDSGTAASGHSVFITSDGTSDGDEGSPFFSGSVVTINAGTFTGVGKSSQ